jgi:uncharacterized damage-inducible protein DinB
VVIIAEKIVIKTKYGIEFSINTVLEKRDEKMYRLTADFLEDWLQESDATLKILENIKDGSLEQKVTSDGRSLGYIAWHIVLSLGDMLGRTDLSIETLKEDEEMPATAVEIVSYYRKFANSVIKEVKQKWTDASLDEEIEIYHERWKRGKILSALISHQAHHRGQLTVLMRQAGLSVPGVYGPSREEWGKYGLPPSK